MKKIIKNNLIESTIRYTENSSRNNGNLRSGVINEASFPENHVKAGIEMHTQNLNNGALNSESEGMLVNHARTKLGYSSSQAKDFANHVINQHTVKKYTSGPRSDLDQENMHGALGGSGKYAGGINEASFPENHVKSGMKVHKEATDNDAMASEAEGAVIHHAIKNLGYPIKKAREFANHVGMATYTKEYTSGPRSDLDRENMHGALGGSGKYAD